MLGELSPSHWAKTSSQVPLGHRWGEELTGIWQGLSEVRRNQPKSHPPHGLGWRTQSGLEVSWIYPTRLVPDLQEVRRGWKAEWHVHCQVGTEWRSYIPAARHMKPGVNRKEFKSRSKPNHPNSWLNRRVQLLIPGTSLSPEEKPARTKLPDTEPPWLRLTWGPAS